MSDSSLQHYGVPGMKWGVRKQRPTSPRKKRSGFVEKVKELHKQRQERALEAEKERVLKSRSPKELYKYAHLFSDQELQSAYNRLNLERNIANLSPKETGRGERYVDNVIKATAKTATFVETGTRLYNNVARVYNTFSDNGKKNPMPIVKDNKEKKDKDKD